MRIKIICMILPVIILVGVLSGCGVKDTTSNLPMNERIKKIESELESSLKSDCEGKFSGSIFIARNGEVLYNKTFGMADYNKNTPVDSNTTFTIGTGASSFTATAIMLLQQKGSLNVNDKISKYIQGITNGDNITIENLLTNSSGIHDYYNLEDSFAKNRQYSLDDLLGMIKGKPQDFEPGKKIESSRSNYVLLGYIIQKVSGKSFEDFVTENIFKVLGMDHSGYYTQNSASENKAIGYEKIGTGAVEAKKYDPSTIFPEGNLYTTTEDLYKFDQALYTEKLLKKDLTNKMFTPYQKLGSGNYTGYLWILGDTDDNNYIAALEGGTSGFTSFFLRDMSKKQTIIILSNMDTIAKNNKDNSDKIGAVYKTITTTLRQLDY
ncbi:MAG: serine hydrolase domain-containing protein [Bacillota bacterium]|nr:serine hydrolase domain-containing protein [Bacillota bacterium]